MDEWKLRTFFAALRLGSFSKAAVELHTTQSAVSQTLRRMEDELGCTLLTRTHAGVALTTAGQALLPSLLAAETALGNIASRAAALTRGQEIPLAIGACASIANTLLPAALQAYQAEHPRARFHLFIGTDILPEWLPAGKVDVALGDASRLGTFAFEPVADDPYFAVVPRTSVAEDMTALTHEALAQLPLLMAPRNVLAEHLAALSQRQTIIDCDDDSTLLSMAAAGLGATAMPALSLESLRPLPASVRILPLVPETKRVLGIAMRNEAPPDVRRFTEDLKTRMQRFFAAGDASEAQES